MQRLPDTVMAGLSAGGEMPRPNSPGARQPGDSEGSSFADLMPRQASHKTGGKEASADLPKEPTHSSPEGNTLPDDGNRLPDAAPMSAGTLADGRALADPEVADSDAALPVLDDVVVPAAFYAPDLVGDTLLSGSEQFLATPQATGAGVASISASQAEASATGSDASRLIELSLPADAVARIDSRFNRYPTSAMGGQAQTLAQENVPGSGVLTGAVGRASTSTTATTPLSATTPAVSVPPGNEASLVSALRSDGTNERARQRLSLASDAASRPITVSGTQQITAPDDLSELASVRLLPARQVAGGHHLPYLDQPVSDRSPRGAAGRAAATVSALRGEHPLAGVDRGVLTVPVPEPTLEVGSKPVLGNSGTGVTVPTVVSPPSVAPTGQAIAAPASTAPVPAFSIDVPVLDPAWQTAMNERVVWMAARNVQTAELRLTPAELGPLTVQVSVEDKSVSLSLSAAHAVTREVLEAALPKLRDMLADNGMNLADANLTGGSSGGADDEATSESGDALVDMSEDVTESATPRRARAPEGAVDLFA